MIKQLNQSVAYICPVCAAVTGRALNIFNFSGKGRVELNCGVQDCRESTASISEGRDKYKITAECPFCGYSHEFAIKKAAFWEKDFLEFNCPVSDMGLFFIGKSQRVRDEIKKQERVLAELSQEFESEAELSLMFDIVSIINDMFENDSVICECGSDNISMNVEEDSIALSCRRCGAVMNIEPSQEEYDRLLNLDILTIRK